MTTPRRSAIWNVFTQTHKNDCLATCNICSQEFSYRSTTTNLMKHLKRKHPGVNADTLFSEEKLKHVEIVIERQNENEREVKSYKVEVKPVADEDSDYIILSSGRRVSPVWEFFTKIPNSDYAAFCNYCRKELSYRSSTFNLKKHIHRKHTEVLEGAKQPLPVEKPQEQVEYDEPKDLENIENDPNPPLDNSDDIEDDAFWNFEDNSDDNDEDFRPSPLPTPAEDNNDVRTASGIKKRSLIWNVFTEKPGCEYIAFCNVCNQEFCYRSTINNLKKHFQRKHPKLTFEHKIELVQPRNINSKFEFITHDTSDEETNNKRTEVKDEEDLLEKNSKRKPSQIWKYFTKKESAGYIATCNLCRKEFGYRSTTSNLKKHLGRKHPHVEFIKTEVEEPKKEPTPEIPVKTCLICLQHEETDTSDFIQVSNCDSEQKSFMNKIQEVMNQPVDIDESHVLCQNCIDDLERVLQFKDKIMKAFEFWNKVESEPEPKVDPDLIDLSADDRPDSDYSDLEDGESLAKFTCSKCQKVFPSPSVMLKHNCDQGRKDSMIVKRDKYDRDNKFYCQHCNKGFSIKWMLSKHLKGCPTNVNKKFVCNMCDRVFKKAYHLREHMASHTGERNYSCNVCGKTFQRSSSKHKHMRSHSARPGEKTKKTPFLCTICGKSFPYSNGASRHMRVHFGERRHECHICSKKFSQTTHLKVHLRTHSGERPYGCIICGRTFSLNASLRKHMRVHVGSGELVKLVKNLETNMETNLGNNIGLDNIEVIDDNMDENLDAELGANITHADVVTEDGIHVLTHHEINLDGRSQ